MAMHIHIRDDSFTPLNDEVLLHAQRRMEGTLRRFDAVRSANVTLAQFQSFADASMCRLRVECAAEPPVVVTCRDRDLKKAIDAAAESAAELLVSRTKFAKEDRRVRV